MGGTPHANATHFPNDESLELELGDWIKPSIAEVLDRGGAAVEREEGPIPSHPHEGHCRPGYQVETAST